VSTKIIRARNGAKFFLPLAFRPRRFGGVTKERLLVGDNVIADRREREADKKKSCEDVASNHEFSL
jgi:hypothetical protein